MIYPLVALLLFIGLMLNALGRASSTFTLSKRVRHFINLTNGLEALPLLLQNGVSMNEISYIRIQSTHCESRNYFAILENLDNNLLMSLALGQYCVLYDFGSRGTGALIPDDDVRSGIPRAWWLGTEWIRHVLSDVWNLEDKDAQFRNVRGYNSKVIFDEQLELMPKALRRRLKYFRPYLQTKKLYMFPLYSKTDKDGEKDFYAQTLKSCFAQQQSSSFTNLSDADAESANDDDEAFSYVLREIATPMNLAIYRSSDFEGFGRSK